MMTPGERFRTRPGVAAMITVALSATLIVPMTITFTTRAEARVTGSNLPSASGRKASVGGTSVRSVATTAPGLGRVVRFPSGGRITDKGLSHIGVR